MNTNEIDRFVRSVCRHHFQGVYSIDTLPDTPRLLISNTDPSDKPGTHWIAISVDSERRGEYFDSFGRQPPAVFEDYMNKHCISWSYNAKQLQSVVSSFCGAYCCVYCMLKCKGFSLNRIINLFTNDTGYNDSIVRDFICG